MKHFYDAKDVSQLLGRSLSYARKRIKAMNDEIIADGYYAESGKVPIKKFHEKYPYIEKEETA
ncbi:hypothetical protein EVU91_04610 [Macrococcoides bohemicum]|uniref:hypothetical protein n=1 Tax=Macrococcoides bohemicum TaxID=1903056 RepID=UPI00105A2C3A|nr:hypothetical protein [Macrococcus bohemicus]TDL39431.1 hypothetical protein EVU91_04610 [Macrococcus bohemicus]